MFSPEAGPSRYGPHISSVWEQDVKYIVEGEDGPTTFPGRYQHSEDPRWQAVWPICPRVKNLLTLRLSLPTEEGCTRRD